MASYEDADLVKNHKFTWMFNGAQRETQMEVL
jgi:hypothetical protein